MNSSEKTGVPRLRLGMVGCGRVAEACHLPALRGLGDIFQVVAVADADEHRVRRVAGTFDVGQAYPSLGAMLAGAAGSLDAIAICTPAGSHAEGVITALETGKHVFVEKPIALALDDADRIVAATEAHAKQKVMVGFNLRHHRLVRQAKQMIEGGVVGEIHQVRTLWTSNIRGRMKVPAWRNRRASGGGVLSEIAVHHIDLMRYLLRADVINAFAQSRHGEGEDEAATLALRLSDGVTVSSTFSELTGDANEIELIGSKGRLSLSIYRFDSLQFAPTGSYGARSGLMRALKELPAAWSILRRGGDFHECYRQEWLAFADAVRNDREPAATPSDGREALRVVLAAGASANQGKPVAIADAPRQPQDAVDRPAAPAPSTAVSTDSTDRPDLSAIISTMGNFESIRRTVDHLRAQTARKRMELLIVCPEESGLMLDREAVKGFWGYRVIEAGSFRTVAVANAAGVRAAAAPIVALCEDHAFPDPNWAESLIIAHRGPYAAVGPAVHNANPDTLVSRADFLVGYGPWCEPIAPGEPDHLPGHNSSYKRDVLLSYGDRLAAMMEAESVLQWDLRSKGQRLYLDPHARLAHVNFSRFKVWTSVQYHAGRVFGGTRAMDWPIWKRLFYACASPLIPLVRLKRAWSQSRRLNGRERVGPMLLLVLLWGFICDGVGQMIGYLLGPEHSKAMTYEFCRVDHITEEDQRQLASREAAVASTPAGR